MLCICKLKTTSHGDINPRNILTFCNKVEGAFMDLWIIKVVLIQKKSPVAFSHNTSLWFKLQLWD